MKIDIVYFSINGSTKNIALSLFEEIGKDVSLVNCTFVKYLDLCGELLIICSPIYDGGLPDPFKEMLRKSKLQYKYVSLILTYGKVVVGNAINDCIDIFPNLCCAATFTANHSFINNQASVFKKDQINKYLSFLFQNIQANNILKSKQKHVFGRKFIEKYHDKFIPMPKKTSHCTNCGKCLDVCPSKNKCICCLSCINYCKHCEFSLPLLTKIGLYLCSLKIKRMKLYK